MANNDFTPNELKNEKWRDVPGFEGLYRISDSGRVVSIDRKVKSRWGGTKIVHGRELIPIDSGHGYFRVSLYKNGTSKLFTVHSLVLLAFVGKRPSAFHIHHRDGNKANNRLNNLCYISVGEHNGGENNGSAKLTDEQVRDIERLYGTGNYTYRDIAIRFGINTKYVGSILKGVRRGIKSAGDNRRYGSRSHKAKLDEQKVKEMRRRFKQGDISSYAQAGREYGVSWMTARRVINGETWKRVR